MRYFLIQPVTINTTPFVELSVNAIRWVVGSIPRGAETTELNVTLMNINSDNEITDMIYSYVLFIPKNILDVWLDDSVIDDFIISESKGLFTKI